MLSTYPPIHLLTNLVVYPNRHAYYMLLFSLVFLLGDLTVQHCAVLPKQNDVLLWLGSAGVLSGLLYHYHYTRYYYYVPIAFILGFAWSGEYATARLAWILPSAIEGKTISITGTIVSIPHVSHRYSQFLFRLDHGAHLVRLTWVSPLRHLWVGDQWHFTARLKRIHAEENPGTVDYEAFALQQGVRAQGYVVARGDNHFLRHCWYGCVIDNVRQYIAERIWQCLPHSQSAKWLVALMVGLRQTVLPEEWEVLRKTGTNHLMAIAGLHIGLLVEMTQHSVAWLWRRSERLILWCPVPLVARCCGLLAGCCYALLAGFPLPTQRACLMLLFSVTAFLLRRPLFIWQPWSLALLLVMVMDPLTVLGDSFWLSFGTLALIVYGTMGRVGEHAWWHKWLSIQWIISLGIMPLTLLLYRETSLVSWVVNILAVPCLSLVILPLCWFSVVMLMLVPVLGQVILQLADISVAILWWLLQQFAHCGHAVWQQVVPNGVIFCLAVLGVSLFLAPAGLKVCCLPFSICCVLPLLFYVVPPPLWGRLPSAY